ncbi:MAG: tetratricopeptide repeat protein, partial [Rudaea sp.]
LREDGDQLRIDLRLIETPSGRTLWAQGYDRQAKDIFAVQQELAQAVASALALRMKLGRSTSPPPDPEVFREYLELRHVFNARPTGEQYREAEIALDALAARAPDFAPVHGLLALNLASHLEPGREQAALPEAMQALKTDPDSTYAHATLGELACMRYEWNDCMKELRTALAFNPADTVMNLLVGMRLARLGYGKEALDRFKIAYAVDPLSYWTNANLGTELDVLGRHEEARSYLDALPALDEKPDPWTAESRWRNALWRNDLVAARDIAAHMPDDFAWKTPYIAFSAALSNPMLWPDAMAKLRAAQEQSGAADWLLLHAPQPNADEVAHLYSKKTLFTGKFIWTREYAAFRRNPAFSDFLRRTKIIDYWNANGWPPQCKPDGDGARCE